MDKGKESSAAKNEQSSSESNAVKYTGAKKKIFALKSSENNKILTNSQLPISNDECISFTDQTSTHSSNLLKMKNKIGKSAPNLAARGNRDVIDPSIVVRRTHHALRSPAVHRISFNCPHQLSPRSESPMGQRSPIDSPRINSPSANHFQFMPFKRLSTNNKFQENRRWSIVSVSLPSSSGYASTSGSNISSQASSQERLHQFPNAPTNEELRLLNNRFSNEPNRMSHQTIQKQQSHPLSQNTTSMSSLILQQQQQQHQQQQLSHRKSFHGSQNAAHSKLSSYPSSSTPPLNSSNDSSNEGSFHGERQQRSLVFRPRSRSLSSPSRSPVTDNHVTSMNALFKERFPKAQIQMDERLTSFINEYKNVNTSSNRDSQPIVRFVTNQILEIARDCLHKSHSKQILTSRYFCDMSENLQRLLIETNEKSPEAAGEIARIIKKLILIISRPARLLECLEFDPEEFYKLLEAAEDQAKINHITNDLPIYIITKLGLNRDPLSDMNQTNSCLDEKDKQSANSSTCSSNKIKDDKCDTSDTSLKDARKCEENPNSSIVSISSDTSCLTSTPIKSSQTTDLSSTTTDKMSTGPTENDYEFIKLISNGAYGSVHLVKHRQTRQRYALKKINKNNLMLRNQVEQVFLERDILSFTDNPFVVTMYGSFETKKHLCLVMEYVEGGDCASLLKNTGPLPCDMARLYFAEMVLAVEYLHSFGIVHRDLKPDNMLITALGHIKLTDFGLSKMGLMSRTTQLYESSYPVDTNTEARQFSDKQIFGTPEYIAPEVILRQGYGKTIDYWSMGIILYEFLVGCVPFFGETPEELFAHVVNDAIIEFPSDDDYPLDTLAKDLILLLLVLNPDERLGFNGPQEVKQHPYLADMDWDSLLRYKAEFIPQLDNDEDTSYFDTRVDRYNHEFEDTDTDDSPILSSNFTSYSPQYRKQCHNRQVYYGSDSSNSSITDSGKMTPDFRTLNINPSKIKMPSTPVDSPFEFPGGDVGSDRPIPSYFLRHQQIKHVLSTAEVLETQNQKLQRSLKNLHITPDTSSQTDHSSDDVSPKIQRRRKNLVAAAAEEAEAARKHVLPKLSFSLEHDSVPSNQVSSPPCSSKNSSIASDKDCKLLKSASAVDLSLKIRASYSDSDKSIDSIRKSKLKFEGSMSDMKLKPHMGSDYELDNSSKPLSTSGGNGSSASSREVSPSRPDGPLIHNQKAPILLKRGKRGFGFTIHTIRVYYGDTDYYTMHHTVMAIDEGSPASQSGLQPGDLITHINGEPVQGLYHTQVLQLLLSSQEHVTLRATPLNQTSIQVGGRKREPGVSKMAKKINPRPKKQRNSSDKKRRASLFRRISSKIANAELFQQQISSASALSPIAPSRSFQNFARNSERSGGSARLSLSPLDPFYQQINISSGSQSSSPSSSVPNTPTSNLNAAPVFHQRPSSLHGLKHKLHSIGGSVKSPSTSRRKSVCIIPLSPLARTPSPSPIQVKNAVSPNSPTRSPSPLALAFSHHPAGSSQLTQSYTPNQSNSSNNGKGSVKLQKSSSFKSNEKDGK